MHVHALIDSMNWGGAELLLADLAAAARAGGWQLTVGYLRAGVNGDPAAERLRSRGVEPVLVGTTSLSAPSDLRRIRRHLRQVAPDVLHTHLGYADYGGGIAARSLGVPTVSTVHVMEWGTSARARARDQLIARARRHCAWRVLTVSDAARRAYLQGGWDRPEHVVTVHNGTTAEPTPGAGPLVRAELGIAADDLVLAMVTVLREGKGHDVAAAAATTLRAEFPRLRLLVVGDGPARETVAAALAPLGDAAVLAGHRDDVAAVLDAADVLIHPSRVDAFPTALLEAAAAGVPVVASAVGGIPEIVTDGVTGSLVAAPLTADRFGAALRPLLDDPELRQGRGQAARGRFAEEFRADRWAGRLLDVYAGALTQRSPSR